ncbi:TonB-dependent receptor domain-containing protein [Caulobacter soli]|uniref:TonB-dependent receptor domain-containing protein n=1 Tax=Caulobacter soli TaxID=2708539 RepID=UPI0013EB57D3|nr:TonB-dependent receptor [Caulobacter soli]
MVQPAGAVSVGSRRTYAIPPSSLADAIKSLALQSGKQALFSAPALEGRRTAGLNGVLTVEEALDRLLRDSGFDYRIVADRMILITAHAPVTASGASAAERPSATARESSSVDTVIVTAVSDEAPPSVERLSARILAGSGVFDPGEVARLSPALNALPSGAGQLKLALRGVYGAGEATTPVYFGGAPVSGPSGTNSDPGLVTPDLALVDIDHVDVLRGPQGFDHGAGAIGGELRIEPNAAVLGRYAGAATLQGRLVQGGAAGGMVSVVENLPVGDDLAVRLVAYRRDNGGYIDNVRLGRDNTNSETTQGVRVAVKARLSDRLEASGMAVYQQRRIGDTSVWNGALGANLSDRYGLNSSDHDLGLSSLTLTFRLPHTVLTSTTAYYGWTLGRRLDSTQVVLGLADDPAGCQRYFTTAADCDATQLDAYAAYARGRAPSTLVQATEIKSLVQELRGDGDLGSGRWAAGLFLERRREHTRSAAQVVDDQGQVDQAAGYTGLRTLGSRFNQAALFAQFVQPIGDRLTLTAGGRYAATRRAAWTDVLIANIISGSTTSMPERTADGGEFNLRARAEWRLGRDASLYVQASQGARPGGVNTTPDPAQAVQTFAPDHLWNYEIGGRRALFHNAMIFEAAAFNIDFHDMQFANATPKGAFSYVMNIGSTRIRGLETALKTDLGRGLSLEFNSAFTDARLTSVSDLALTQFEALPGDRVPNIPRYRHTATLAYRRALTSDISALLSWQNERRSAITSSFRPDDPDYLYTPAGSLDTFTLALDRGHSNLTVALRNVFDKETPDRAISSPFGRDQIYGATPRTLTVTVRRSW